MKINGLAVLSIASCLTFGQAFAEGGGSGNGGDAVVCREYGARPVRIVSAELLDYYEGRQLRRLSPRAHAELTDEQYIDKIGDTLLAYDAVAYADFKSEALKLMAAVKEFRASGTSSDTDILFTNEQLRDIPDAGTQLVMSNNCRVEQLAIRTTQEFPDDPKYIIQADILRAMDPLNARGLVLHEAVYKTFVEKYRDTNSVGARYLHQKLTARPAGDIVIADLVAAIRRVREATITKSTPGGRAVTLSHPFTVLPDGSISGVNEKYEYNGRIKGVLLVMGSSGQLDLAKSLSLGGVWSPDVTVPVTKYEVSVDGAPAINLYWSPDTLIPFGDWAVSIETNSTNAMEVGVSVYASSEEREVKFSVPYVPGTTAYQLSFQAGLDSEFRLQFTP